MQHFILKRSLNQPYPENTQQALFGMGCFWGAEKCFWSLNDEFAKDNQAIYITAVGYAAGDTENPSYQDVCSGSTNHNEVVLIVFYPELISYETLLKAFWENHNPTQGMRQGNDRGTQYRSGVYCYNESQMQAATQSKQQYQKALDQANYSKITTEILQAPQFYFAEEYHQQYLAKNPQGYCGLGGVGVCL